MCALTNNFRSWIDVISEELEFVCLKEAKRNFHAKLSGIVEPLLQKGPLMLLLPALEVISPPSSNHTTLVSSETTLEAGSVFGVKKTVIYEEIIMKDLEDLKAENYEVKVSLSNTEEMFKH